MQELAYRSKWGIKWLATFWRIQFFNLNPLFGFIKFTAFNAIEPPPSSSESEPHTEYITSELDLQISDFELSDLVISGLQDQWLEQYSSAIRLKLMGPFFSVANSYGTKKLASVGHFEAFEWMY